MQILVLVTLTLLMLTAVAVSETSEQYASNVIKLPQPRTDGGISLQKALQERQAIKSFSNEPLTLEEVSQLLWAAQGITDDKGHRTTPSCLASYPLEIYLLAGNVTGLSAGVYHYSPQGHNLTAIASGNRIHELFSLSESEEDWKASAPAIFIITGVFERLNKIVGKDWSRFVYVEAGAAAENMLLEVVSLDLGSALTIKFDENKTRELLGLSGGEEPLGVLPVGRKAQL